MGLNGRRIRFQQPQKHKKISSNYCYINMDSQSGTLNINISDSAYSKSTNSHSQRSASSKSHPSGSNSSKTSGYDGATNGANECLDVEEQALIKHNKDKEHKKKKSKSAANCNGSSNTLVTGCLKQNENFTFLNDVSMGVENLTYYNAKSSTKQSVPACNPNELINVVEDGVKAPLNGDNLKNSCNEINMQNDVSGLASTPIIDQLEPFNKISAPQVEDGFCCVISMSDGLVLFTSPNITNTLGFSTDMWLGRSFTDFVHPKDRDTFCNQVTTGVAIPLIDAMGKKRDTKSSLYVYLRKYKGLRRSGYGVIEKNVRYQAFHLTVTFKNSTEYANSKDLGNNGGIFLVIVAVPIFSSYKVPDEKTRSKKFIMRHTSACIFSHVDADVVMNFGYFPQDMLGKSVFDFYHPEDMPFMKDVYESVMTNCHIAGSVYRSKPYRFAIRNGDFVMVETEWSSFLNPWSRRLEFITGLHQVLQGPTNPNSFEVIAEDKTKSFSQNILREAKIIQDEILFLLKKELVKPIGSERFEVSSRCKNLSTFMDTIMSEVIQTDLKVNLPMNRNVSLSERESVMLGEISPHHDYYDRQSSSETPPSYNQLNYNENLQRFFKSKPMTTNESAEKPSQLHNAADLFVKDLPPHQERNQKWLSPIQTSGDSGSGSAENLGSEISPNMDVTSATNTSNDSYSRPHLTQELLLKHNVDMENIMQQRHREKRSNFKAVDKGNSKYFHKSDKKVEKESGNKREEGHHHHGIKRSISGSWDGDNHKISKYHHHVNSINEVEEAILKNKEFNKAQNDVPSDIANNCNDNCYMSKTKNINLWPPFSVSMTAFGNNPSHSTNANPIGTYLPGMFPTYCFQTQQGHGLPDFNLNNHTSHFQVQYLPSMMYNYNPIFSPTSATFCPQVAMLPYPHFSPLMTQPNQKPATGCVSTTNELTLSPHVGESMSELQRCRSQTSIKAEPGSAIGSAVSACNFNHAMSECSRKDCCLFSVYSPDFPFVNSPDCEGYLNCGNLPEKNTDKVEQTSAFNMIRQDEESSYSSFYSSFLKTDTGSGSNDDSIAVGSTNTCKDKEKYEKPQMYSVNKFDPPWLEAVSVTPDFVYHYQMTVKNLENILESDLKVLKSIEQPLMVNDQLEQLYLELDLAGLSTKLTLEEGITSSSSNSGDESGTGVSQKLKRRRNSYSSLTMIYEENAPLPPAPDYK